MCTIPCAQQPSSVLSFCTIACAFCQSPCRRCRIAVLSAIAFLRVLCDQVIPSTGTIVVAITRREPVVAKDRGDVHVFMYDTAASRSTSAVRGNGATAP